LQIVAEKIESDICAGLCQGIMVFWFSEAFMFSLEADAFQTTGSYVRLMFNRIVEEWIMRISI
jgi:hypothetical protein